MKLKRLFEAILVIAALLLPACAPQATPAPAIDPNIKAYQETVTYDHYHYYSHAYQTSVDYCSKGFPLDGWVESDEVTFSLGGNTTIRIWLSKESGSVTASIEFNPPLTPVEWKTLFGNGSLPINTAETIWLKNGDEEEINHQVVNCGIHLVSK